MVIGVLGLQGAFREHINFLKKMGISSIAVKKPEEIENIDGLIIPGGESTTIGRLMKTFNLDIAIKERFKNGSFPIYGTCAGMIILAKRISGFENQFKLDLMDIAVERNAFGRQKDSSEKLVDIKGFDKPFLAVFIRAPVIKETGKNVEVLSSVDEGAVLVREGNLLASSFHPELGDDTRIHEIFVDMIKK